jgi:intracellular multiplication protein IcmJ
MELLPLTLTATRGSWRKYYARSQNKRFPDLSKKIWTRDDNKCRYCNFQSKKYMTVVNKDGDYDNNAINNLVTACTWCAQCSLLDGIAMDPSFGGRLIYLPEISQVDLNHFCRLLFCAMDKGSPYKGRLQAIYLNFKDRYKAIDNCFGPNTSYPAVFGQGLIDTYLEKKELRHPLMNDVRLLPTKSPVKAALAYWKTTVFANIPI